MPTQKDPTTFGYQNFYSTTLTGDITASTLTIGLATVPTPTSGILVIEPDSTSSREIILYTSKGASTVTCPADGRGWSGTSATSHLTGSTVIMASVDEYFEGLADGTLSTDPLRTALASNFVVSGGVVAQSSGLIGTFSNIIFYLNGQRYSGTSIANKTYTASKDTYVDVTATSGGTVSVTYSEVANGAASPALAANYVRIAKVVTNGSAITSVVQGGSDTLSNKVCPKAPDIHAINPIYRQGGGASNWQTSGTTSYDIRGLGAFTQMGSRAITAADTAITFPVPFSQAPIIVATVNSAASVNTFVRITGQSTTGFLATCITDGGAASSSETINWVAIGV